MGTKTVYIEPNLRILSTFDETDSHLKDSPSPLGLDRGIGTLADLSSLTRCLIVGEPGMGKTALLEQLKERFKSLGRPVQQVRLRDMKAVQFLRDATNRDVSDGPLLLDGLDKVSASNRGQVVSLIESLGVNKPALGIFVSSRWVFVRGYRNSFSKFRYAALTPFSWKQVREYLLRHDRTEAQFEQAWKIFQRGWSTSVLQTPRYLELMNQSFDRSGTLPSSRRELFDHFVQSKLGLEDSKGARHLAPITTRLLEKIALAMEIYQANSITKDDLLTAFDQITSDLKLIALSQVPFDELSGNSLLRIGQAGEDTVEFESVEFQEFLAAKELARMPDPARAAFAFAVESGTEDVLPSWHNTLTFLGENSPHLLEKLVEFANFRGSSDRLVDDEFVVFLSRFDPSVLSNSARRVLFSDIVAHFQNQRRWLPHQIGPFLRLLFDPGHEAGLRAWMTAAETARDGFVLQANVVSVIGDVLGTPNAVDKGHWRSELLRIAKNKGVNPVPQRNALYALEQMGDATVVTEFAGFDSDDESVRKACFSMLARLSADDPITVEQLVAGVRDNIIEARTGLSNIHAAQSFRRVLSLIGSDDTFAANFLKHGELRRTDDETLIGRLAAVLDPDLLALIEAALIATLRYHVVGETEDSSFVSGMWALLYRSESACLQRIVQKAASEPSRQVALHSLPRFIAPLIREDDVPGFVGALKQSGQERLAFRILSHCRSSRAAEGEALFEAGRLLMPDVYAEWDAAQRGADKERPPRRPRNRLDEFLFRLEPEPNQFIVSVFESFNDHHDEIQSSLSPQNLDRLETLATNILRDWNPRQFQLVVAGGTEAPSFTLSGGVSVFGAALTTASLLGVDLSRFRQQLLDFIPFSSADQRKEILQRTTPIRPDEARHLIDSYRRADSPFRRYQPEALIEIAEQLAHGGVTEVLRSFVEDSGCSYFVRRRALQVLDSLNNDPDYLRSLFARYRTGDGAKKDIAEAANALLITNHGDASAFRWRLDEIVARATEFQQPVGVHSVSDLEAELRHGSAFAAPLMALSNPEMESSYLDLIDQSLNVWERGQGFHAYADYLQGIVHTYFNGLRGFGSYAPLLRLERKLSEVQSRGGANWLAVRMLELRRAYLTSLSRPKSMATAVALYNRELARQALQIGTADDLAIHLRDCLDGDVRRWVEGEGAYNFLVGQKVFAAKKQSYEALIQRTLGAQIEMFLLRNGFNVEALREPQTVGDTRVDFLVRYGFAGPVLIELKLSSHRDLNARDLAGQKSLISLKSYMAEFNARRALFVVVDNVGNPRLNEIRSVYSGLSGVSVVVLRAGGGKATPKPKPTKRSFKKTWRASSSSNRSVARKPHRAQ